MILTLLKISLPTKSAAYADDVTAAGSLINLKNWWENLIELGPKYGYFPEATKSWLIVKDDKMDEAQRIFEGSNIRITSDGKRHLGAVIGSSIFKDDYVNEKIAEWIREIKLLSNIAKTEPQAAFNCFISGYKNKVTFFMRTIPGISENLKQLDQVILTDFIPSFTGRILCTEIQRILLSLPPKLGGLGIPIFSEITDVEYLNSQRLTNSLRQNIFNQKKDLEAENVSKEIKRKIKAERFQRNNQTLIELRASMSEQEKRLNDLSREDGASIWLTTLLLKDEGYVLTKQQFWDSIKIRYVWLLDRVPENCECGNKFNVQHALSCKKGGFISQRHNQIRNMTALLLGEVCKDVRLEPALQPLTGEAFNSNVNISDEARSDISARGFWQTGQVAFFDIRVFNPTANRYCSQEISKSMR
eukprot:gene5131-biopygen4184